MDGRLYDSQHRRVGTVSKDLIGNDVILGDAGQVVARFDTDAIGNRVLKDANGRLIGIFGKDLLGNDVIFDGQNKVIARFGTDSLGGNALLDANGKVIGRFERTSAPSSADDDDDDPYYNRLTGKHYYPRSPLEKKLIAECSKWVWPAFLSYILPALYVLAAIAWKKLPASPELLIGILTAGIFFSSLFGRAANYWDGRSHAATFFISLLLYYVWFVVWTNYRVAWNVSQKREMAVLLAGPVLFLLAELVGGLIGHGIYRRAKKRIFKY